MCLHDAKKIFSASLRMNGGRKNLVKIMEKIK